MKERKSDRVVLDVNIIVAHLLKEDYEFFVDLRYLYNVDVFTCHELIDELINTLNYPRCKKHLKKAARYYTDFVKDMSSYISIDQRFDRAPDIKDNYLFDLAYATKSYYLVTSDKR